MGTKNMVILVLFGFILCSSLKAKVILCNGEGVEVTKYEVEVFKKEFFRGFPISEDRLAVSILENRLLSMEARKFGLDRDKKVKTKLILSLERILAKAYKDMVLSKRIKVEEKEIESFYEKNKDKFRAPIKVRIREHRFSEKKKAEAFLKGKLKGKGKDLGFMVPFQIAFMYPSLSKDILNQNKRFYGPIKKGKTFVVLEVVERKGGKIRPLDENLKKRIRKILFERKKKRVIENELRRLMEKYKVSCTK